MKPNIVGAMLVMSCLVGFGPGDALPGAAVTASTHQVDALPGSVEPAGSGESASEGVPRVQIVRRGYCEVTTDNALGVPVYTGTCVITLHGMCAGSEYRASCTPGQMAPDPGHLLCGKAVEKPCRFQP